MIRSVGSLILVMALLASCGGGDASTSGLSVGEWETASSTGATSTSTSTSTAPTTGTTSTGSASGTTTAEPTTDPLTTTTPTTSTATTTDATTEPAGTSTTTGTGTTADSTTGPSCGDGNLDADEDCDGADLGGATCMSLGFTQGVLACADSCQLDTSGCMGMPACAVALDPPGAMVCPPECTGGCDMNINTCRVNCDGNVCDNITVTCPANWACDVSCIGTTACVGATINCPAQYACEVLCDGTAACEPATFNCGDGPCHIGCDGTVACDGSTLNCGLGDGEIECIQVTSSTPVPVPEPMSSCLCEVVGC